MTVAVMLFVLFGGAILQSALPGWAVLGHAKAPFLLAAVLYYALTSDRGTMLIAGVLAGVLQDALSPIPLGYTAACFCLSGLVASGFRPSVFGDSAITAAFFGAVGAAVSALAISLLLWRDGLTHEALWEGGLRTVGAGLLGMVFTPLVFFCAGRLDFLVGNVRRQRGPGDEKIRYI